MNSILPQPPANQHSSTERHVRGKHGLIWLLGGTSIVFCALWGFNAFVIRPHEAAFHRSGAHNNLRALGMMLADFESEYGRFPHASTIPAVQSDHGTTIPLGDHSSNQLFRQLIVYGCKTEKPFWAKTTISPKGYDDVFATDATILAPGEVAFAYIPGHSSKSPADTPLIMAPISPDKRSFDPEPFMNKAVVLFADKSVHTLRIDRQGRAILNGMDLLDPRQPFWGGKIPDVKWPE